MSGLVLAILHIGFLVLLWVFVLAVMATLRRDIYGVSARGRQSQVSPVSRSRPRSSAPKPQRGVPTKIVVSAGPLAGTTVPLGSSSIIVGRSPDSALVLDDSYSSARHARFFHSEGQWYVEDLQSTNGTFVHGARIEQPTLVKPGDAVTVGQTTMTMQR
ncbi:FHA domain-containing protein FhaB/FipA [Flaviflexus huanghaiensis]|uniref:FHA domain-containing protein FhaB/FipA n=1 Tax=Flaviflexus huanghaiensis TaxID=1111473 RepID=UPI0015FDB36E|nr:FHA domain-containing protein [Flaviflexus huanghaiensis]